MSRALSVPPWEAAVRVRIAYVHPGKEADGRGGWCQEAQIGLVYSFINSVSQHFLSVHWNCMDEYNATDAYS